MHIEPIREIGLMLARRTVLLRGLVFHGNPQGLSRMRLGVMPMDVVDGRGLGMS